MGKRRGFLPCKTIGKRVVLHIDDHSIRDTSETLCEVEGIVTKVTDTEILLRFWTSFNPGTLVAEDSDDNHEYTRVVQGTLVRWAYAPTQKWNEVR